MATSSVSVLLLITYWFLNHGSKGRLQQVKWMGWLYNPKWCILERANIVFMFAAGFGLSQFLSGWVSWMNFRVPGLEFKLFTALMWAGLLLFLLDCVNGNGIKKSSHGIAFAMPVVAVANAGGLATLILMLAGGINQWFGSLFGPAL